METTNFTAPDIECDGCANAIKRALGKIAGVSEVSVNVEAKSVAVSHDMTVSNETLVQSLNKAGFPVN